MSEFTKVYSKWHAQNNRKYDSAIKYHKALMKNFKDWQPPKQLVEVPKFVADYIETEEYNDYNRVGTLVYGHYTAGDRGEKHSELHGWITDNFDTFLNAIVNGYTVKKEQLYKVVFMDKVEYTIFSKEEDGTSSFGTPLTERKIKSIDERYWAFAVKVDEVDQ